MKESAAFTGHNSWSGRRRLMITGSTQCDYMMWCGITVTRPGYNKPLIVVSALLVCAQIFRDRGWGPPLSRSQLVPVKFWSLKTTQKQESRKQDIGCKDTNRNVGFLLNRSFKKWNIMIDNYASSTGVLCTIKLVPSSHFSDVEWDRGGWDLDAMIRVTCVIWRTLTLHIWPQRPPLEQDLTNQRPVSRSRDHTEPIRGQDLTSRNCNLSADRDNLKCNKTRVGNITTIRHAGKHE